MDIAFEKCASCSSKVTVRTVGSNNKKGNAGRLYYRVRILRICTNAIIFTHMGLTV